MERSGSRTLLMIVAVLATLALVATGCGDSDEGGGDGGSGGEQSGPATLRVPADHPTIQEAVDAASPGDLVLIEPGVYKEAVTVTTYCATRCTPSSW